jgi:hypothetical protein
MANKRYTTIPNDFCISFDNFAKVEECEQEIGGFQGLGFNFTTLKAIQESSGIFMLDLIAVVTNAQPPSQIQIKQTGEWKDKRTLELSDDTGVSI